MSQLVEFLKERKNSRSRERILMHRMLYDLQLAAAHRGYFLEAYSSEVDQDGFDVILDDRDISRRIQVKSLWKPAGTQGWRIQKGLLRPEIYFAETMGLECTHGAVGMGGGIILMEVEGVRHRLNVTYYYTDMFVMLAQLHGVLKLTERAQRTLTRLFRNLSLGTSTDKVSVPKTLFLRARSAEHLLALMGLHSNHSYAWLSSIVKLVRRERRAGPIHPGEPPSGVLRSFAANGLKKLTSRPRQARQE